MISRSNGRYFIFDASSTKRGEGEEREEEGGRGEMVDCSKLHQRRDNRVVDCVDRYSIFGELVAARRQPIARKIQLSLPT